MSFQKCSDNFNEDVLCLVFTFVDLGVSNAVGSGSSLGVGSGVGVRTLSMFFIGIILLLKVLRIIKKYCYIFYKIPFFRWYSTLTFTP